MDYIHTLLIYLYFCIHVGPHAPCRFHGGAATALGGHGGRGAHGGRGICGGHGICSGRGRGRGDPDAVPSKSYSDPDVGNPLPPFAPSRPVGIHFGRPLLRNAMTRAVDFFYLFLQQT